MTEWKLCQHVGEVSQRDQIGDETFYESEKLLSLGNLGGEKEHFNFILPL